MNQDIMRNTIRHEIVDHKSTGFSTSDVVTPMFSTTDVEQIIENILFHFNDQILQARIDELDQLAYKEFTFIGNDGTQIMRCVSGHDIDRRKAELQGE